MFKNKLHLWAQDFFLHPSLTQRLLAYALLPLSLVYAFCVCIKKFYTKEKDFYAPIISIGNLTLGGSGKTPLGIAIANEFSGSAIILRGYGRASKGMILVAKNGKILTDVAKSGDEAMEYAKCVRKATVIVSEKREKAIELAKNLGAKYILLDDGFGKFHIKKFNILVVPTPEPKLNFCIPSGVYRYPKFFYKYSDFIAKEGISHFRESEILAATSRMVLVTAIANPSRLEQFFNKSIAQVFFPDHHTFSKKELSEILEKYNATSLLMTQKDIVKVENFNLPISLIKLKTTLCDEFKSVLKTFLL
ncbi:MULTISPECIES: tetraacyldisaccharide 4'-kinase [unclassified Campylobacter]|uniref:tetraacyldisaccharide 4'-kinase n=1 Tax=unclassified Campylobacter TaxID=2593542 RepID=UPI003D3430BB